jgi:hypothetical protein
VIEEVGEEIELYCSTRTQIRCGLFRITPGRNDFPRFISRWSFAESSSQSIKVAFRVGETRLPERANRNGLCES